jgi:hypothetical protein
MSASQPFPCEVPGCTGFTSRIPHVCTSHFLEGWGRIKPMPEIVQPQPEPNEKPPLYVSDKPKAKK